MDFCKNELYNKELRFEESNRCSSLVRKKPSNFFRSTSKIVEWEKKKRAKRIKNVLQCPMC